MEGILQHQNLLYVPEIIPSKLISYYYDNLLVEDFGIKKIRELVARKYFFPILCQDV